jgi:hypothetical protein
MQRAAMPVIETFVGATALPLSFTINQQDGTAFNLTNYTLALTAKLDGVAKISAVSVTVDTAASGLCHYTPTTSTMVDTAGDMQAIIWMTTGGTTRPTEPFIIRVRPTATGG